MTKNVKNRTIQEDGKCRFRCKVGCWERGDAVYGMAKSLGNRIERKLSVDRKKANQKGWRTS